jgi:hypothetical protein
MKASPKETVSGDNAKAMPNTGGLPHFVYKYVLNHMLRYSAGVLNFEYCHFIGTVLPPAIAAMSVLRHPRSALILAACFCLQKNVLLP